MRIIGTHIVTLRLLCNCLSVKFIVLCWHVMYTFKGWKENVRSNIDIKRPLTKIDSITEVVGSQSSPRASLMSKFMTRELLGRAK